MSKMKLATIICWIVSLFVLVGLAVWFIFGAGIRGQNVGTFLNFNWNITDSALDVEHTTTMPIEGVYSLDIDWTAGRLTIKPHDGDEIQITEFSRRELRDEERKSVSIENNTLNIDFRAGRVFGNVQQKNLELLIPRELAAQFDAVSVNSTSGRVNVNGITADTLEINSISGRIELRNIETQTLRANATSGRIELVAVNANAMNLRSISGRIELLSGQVQHLDTHTTSGRQYLNGIFDNATVRSISGRVEFRSEVVPDSLDVNATSGRIAVIVPSDEPISVQHSGTGRFESEIPIITGTADAQFRLHSTSGRIVISEWVNTR